MSKYAYENNKFTVYDYNNQSPFANFLPGIAGKMGIPLWVFYTNRGQGISGYGIQDKNHPIMAFTPANKAYEITPITGFRTFIKVGDKIYEPFAIDSKEKNKMTIDFDSFSIEELNQTLNLKIKVTYFGLVNEPLGGLVRKVDITNIGQNPIDMEVLDGIAEILPSGIQNQAFKATSNLLASWADVKHLEDALPFFTLRASTGDTSEVKKHESGNFYVGVYEGALVKPIVDPAIIFGENTLKSTPCQLADLGIEALINQKQVTTNKFACAFIPIKKSIQPDETITLHALTGHAKTYDILKDYVNKLIEPNYLEEKQKMSKEIIRDLIQDVDSKTAFPIFDAYVKQNYLDNLVRGGYPEKIGDSIYHLYSRRHGDLERDYNFFSLAPEYYSQGNGNFRDVCQNRRLDSFFNRDVQAFNIMNFSNLLQLDGYNPLAINGILYQLKDDVNLDQLLDELFVNSKSKLNALFQHPFTPGTIVNYIEQHEIQSRVPVKDYLDKIIQHSKPSIQASFGEGFWIDHFTYVLDLIESYQSIYPDRMEDLLFNKEDYLYFDSPVSVRKKTEKLVLNQEGNVRQYGSLVHFDQEKVEKLKMNPHGSNWVKMNGEVYRSNLYNKLFVLVLNKHSLLDPDGIGIEMEAEKPGWNDAMNGLPGLIGSGVSESIELLRIVDFLLDYPLKKPTSIPQEVYEFFVALNQHSSYQERVRIREKYRDQIRFGLSGEIQSLDNQSIEVYLKELKDHIEKSLSQLFDDYDGVIPTFLRYEVTDYTLIRDENSQKIYHQDYPLVKALKYKRHALTPFLEAPARLLKSKIDHKKLEKMYEKIRSTGLYDQALKMYKTSDCLNHESHEIGRIHAFTKGWLERESNFLHMTYKYLLGLLKAGLYEAFYQEINDNLVCFMKPEIYKRSTLENSSFIATSNNPDTSIHGKGYFARLSGSTVEAVNMWTHMMTGGKPFIYRDGELFLEFKPKLHQEFFDENKEVQFTFLKDIRVKYIADELHHTYDDFSIKKIVLANEQESIEVKGEDIKGELARNIRDGHYKTLDIYIN